MCPLEYTWSLWVLTPHSSSDLCGFSNAGSPHILRQHVLKQEKTPNCENEQERNNKTHTEVTRSVHVHKSHQHTFSTSASDLHRESIASISTTLKISSFSTEHAATRTLVDLLPSSLRRSPYMVSALELRLKREREFFSIGYAMLQQKTKNGHTCRPFVRRFE